MLAISPMISKLMAFVPGLWTKVVSTHYRAKRPFCPQLDRAATSGYSIQRVTVVAKRTLTHPPPTQTCTELAKVSRRAALRLPSGQAFLAPGSSDSLASANASHETSWLYPAVRLALLLRPSMSGQGLLCGLRLSVSPFPTRTALHLATLVLSGQGQDRTGTRHKCPTVSEYYGLIRLPGSLRLPYLSFRPRLARNGRLSN